MILLLFPSMTELASVLILAAVWIWSNEIFYFPIVAKNLLIIINMRFSSKILPIVRINTRLLIMIIAPWAPCSFKVKYVEIWILRLHLVEQINCNFIFWMCECAHLPIFTTLHVIWIRLTKLALIFLRMVEFLHSIVCFETLLSEWEALIMSGGAGYLWAHLACIRAKLSASIFFEIVIEETSLRVVLWLALVLNQKRAWLSFEFCQIQENQNVLGTFLLPREIWRIVWNYFL